MAARGRRSRLLVEAESGDQGPVPSRQKKIQSAATKLVGGSSTEYTDTEEMQQREVSGGLPAEPIINTPPLPPSPESGEPEDDYEWINQHRRLTELAAKDPRRELPTVMKPKDQQTAECVFSSKDKELVRGVARSIVSVCPIGSDGKVIRQCTGVIISWNETKNCARILTSFRCIHGLGLDPKPKLQVRLPNKMALKGQILFFNEHYNIALLEISSKADLPLQLPSFGSNPNYGQEVFVLTRGEETNLMARHGTILWFEESDHLGRNYQMFLSCKLPEGGNGGLVIHHDGNVAGITFFGASPHPSILAISTILTCIEMWMKFSRIARPIHGLRLRTVELLEVSLQERIYLDHNINSGYIVDKVSVESAAGRLGIRYGDVIVSIDGLHVHTLPQLEDYLLSLGWGSLQRSIDSSSTVDLKLQVYDLLKRNTRSITLPVEFCDASENRKFVSIFELFCYLVCHFLSSVCLVADCGCGQLRPWLLNCMTVASYLVGRLVWNCFREIDKWDFRLNNADDAPRYQVRDV